MVNLFIVAFLGILLFCRWVFLTAQGKRASYTIISYFIVLLPFGISKSVYGFFQGVLTEDNKAFRLGEFGNLLKLEIPILILVFLLLLGFNKVKRRSFSIKENKWFYIVLAMSGVSMINPSNTFRLAILPFLFSFIQFFLLFKAIDSNFSRKEIFKGIFEGIVLVLSIQFALTIFYPILGIEFVTTLFRENALEWAQRRGMNSAVGTFSHPGHLALYCLIFIFFFLSTYLNGYKKKLSSISIILSLITLILTFSRTALLCGIMIVPILLLFYFKGKKAISASTIIYFLLLVSTLLAILYLSPLSSLFLESDADVQVSNRFIHWILGYQMWQTSPWIGIGINTHVYYMLNNMSINFTSNITLADTLFFLRSPIHNIHIIVLAEAGTVGLLLWCTFFWTSIKSLYTKCRTDSGVNNILNLTYIGVLLVVFSYGFFGWAPFVLEVYSFCLTLGYFSKSTSLSNS